MSQVVVVATFEVQDGKADEAEAALRETIEATHAEAGCLSYALHRDVNAKNVFVLVEKWTSQVALDAHFHQPYVKALGEKAAAVLAAPPAIRFCAPIPVGDPMKGTL
jgi:quinol monooxygenase YgiN